MNISITVQRPGNGEYYVPSEEVGGIVELHGRTAKLEKLSSIYMTFGG